MASWSSKWQQFLELHPELISPCPPPYFSIPALNAKELAKDEDFWQQVLKHFPVGSAVVNLNSGAVSMAPLLVEKAFTHYYSLVNQAPSYYLWKVMEQGRELIREGLAGLINASTEEVAMLRNTTEALNNVIMGMDLQPGDEIVASRQDYLKAVSSWKQRTLREGIKVNWVDLGGPEETDDAIVAKYVAQFTPHTRLLQLTHVINWNGQILPVQKIIAEAKKRNIEVLLDGAHSFGLLSTDMQALSCDYFTTALHKWLSGPISGALLYVKKEKISALWPLASSLTPQADNIRKFEELSIQLMPALLGLGYAMDYHEWLGRENKEERLRYLHKFLRNQLQEGGAVNYLTPAEDYRYCAILGVALEGWEPAKLEQKLLAEHQLHVGLVQWENYQGIRITPNVYTSPQELSLAARAISSLAAQA